MWKNLSVDLFKECTEKLKTDEFIYSSSFKCEQLLACPFIGNKKLDAHLAAENCFSIEDAINGKCADLVDEKATMEDIRAICGYFLDQQFLRFDGHMIWTTILSCIYLHKRYEIQNKALSSLFKMFSYVTLKIEAYANEIGTHRNTFWSYCSNATNYIDDYSPEEIKKELKKINFPPDIKALIEFEFDFANLLDDPINNTMKDVYNVPATSKPIGFAPCLHYRDLHTSCTPIFKEVDHNETLQKLNDFLKDINNIKEEIIEPNVRRLTSPQKEPQVLSQLISSIYSWNEKSYHLSIVRLILFDIIIGHSNDIMFFGKISNSDLLEAELEPYGLAGILKRSKQFVDLVSIFGSTIYPICRDLIYPLPFMHSQFVKTDLKVWQSFQKISYEIYSQEQRLNKSNLRISSQQHKQKYDMRFLLWSISVATNLVYITYRSGFFCKLYGPKDYHIVWYLLNFACSNEFSALDQLRVVRSIYTLSRKQKKKAVPLKGNDIDNHKESESQETILRKVQAKVFSALTYFYVFLKRENAIDDAKGIFDNEIRIYEERSVPASRVLHLSVDDYGQFIMNLYDEQEVLKKNTISILDEAKTMATQLKKDGYKKEECDAIIRTILSSIFAAKGYSAGKKVTVVFPISPLYPCFEFVKK